MLPASERTRHASYNIYVSRGCLSITWGAAVALKYASFVCVAMEARRNAIRKKSAVCY